MSRWLTGDLFDSVHGYDSIVFKTQNIYNKPAPSPIVSIWIGSILSLLTIIVWYFGRWRPTRKQQTHLKQTNRLALRTFIARLADNENTLFTILRLSGQSFLFLAGFQVNYEATMIAMLIYYGIISLGDSIRVLLAISEEVSIRELVVVARKDKALLSPVVVKEGRNTIELTANNVYEDLSKDPTLVTLVFFTQAIMISFIVVDLYRNDTMTTLDGTPKVPVLCTLGSWLVYVLGLFMQAVYILGPKSSFGTSEQNPHFWMQFLLCSKYSGATVRWKCPLYGVQHERPLKPSDPALWGRFVLSYFINGLGFHILIHALPVQVASQSTLVGIVIRAVGVMYLVDLDDAPGVKLTVCEGQDPSAVKKLTSKCNKDCNQSSLEIEETENNVSTVITPIKSVKTQEMAFNGNDTRASTPSPLMVRSSVELQLRVMLEETKQKIQEIEHQMTLLEETGETGKTTDNSRLNPYEMAMVQMSRDLPIEEHSNGEEEKDKTAEKDTEPDVDFFSDGADG
jgi:hypothetical protein